MIHGNTHSMSLIGKCEDDVPMDGQSRTRLKIRGCSFVTELRFVKLLKRVASCRVRIEILREMGLVREYSKF